MERLILPYSRHRPVNARQTMESNQLAPGTPRVSEQMKGQQITNHLHFRGSAEDPEPSPRKPLPFFLEVVSVSVTVGYRARSISHRPSVSSTSYTQMGQQLVSSLHMPGERLAHILFGSPWIPVVCLSPQAMPLMGGTRTTARLCRELGVTCMTRRLTGCSFGSAHYGRGRKGPAVEWEKGTTVPVDSQGHD